jgi:hypothetical protein
MTDPRLPVHLSPDPLHVVDDADRFFEGWDEGYERGREDSLLTGLAIGIIVGLVLAIAVFVALAILAAPRSAATAIPAGNQMDLPPSGTRALPSEAPLASPSPAAVRPTRSPATSEPVQLSDGGGVWGAPPPTTRPKVSGDVRRGWATFYCCTRGYGSTPVVALPGARYVPLGRQPWGWARVTVISGGKVVASESFPVVDACACGPRHGLPTVVDLSAAAAHELGLNTVLGESPGMWRVLVEVTR